MDLNNLSARHRFAMVASRTAAGLATLLIACS
ncbi:hypothetical protein SPAN111604_07010 [Sphingomonas antarctica]